MPLLRRELHQSRMSAALINHACDLIFLANMRLVDVLDGHFLRRCQIVRTLANAFAQRIRKSFGVIEYFDVVGIQVAGHAFRITCLTFVFFMPNFHKTLYF